MPVVTFIGLSSSLRTNMSPQLIPNRFPRLAYILFGGILGIAMVATGGASQAKSGNSADSTQFSLSKENDGINHTMDKPIELIKEALKAYSEINDYKCTLFQVERFKGKMQPEAVLSVQSTTKPFQIHMKWMEPRASRGQEAIYIPQKDSQKMRVKGAGFLGAVGFITLDIKDPKACANNRHTIDEAGLHNLIHRLHDGWIEDAKRSDTQVLISTKFCMEKECECVELTHPENPEGYFLFYKNVVYFDKITKLPIKIENYSWPINGDPAPLEESYSYKDLVTNSGLDLSVFQK